MNYRSKKSVRFLLFLIISLCAVTAFGKAGIKPNTSFKLPFTVDGNETIHRAQIVVDDDGVSTLVIDYVSGEEILTLKYILTRQDGPSPNPDPDPDPNPPVTIRAVVIEESKERTPEQAIVLASEKVRASFPGGFRLVDPLVDEKKVTVPDDVKGWVEKAIPKRKSWPYLFIVNEKNKPVYQGALPKTIAEMDKIVEKVKKGGRP